MLKTREPLDGFVTNHALTVPKILTTADNRARWLGSSTARRSIKYPTNTIQQISIPVRRASHAHHTPHCCRPQMDPVTRFVSAKASETSVIDAASESHHRSFLTRYTIEHASPTPNPVSPRIPPGM